MGILRCALLSSCCVLNLGAHTFSSQPEVFPFILLQQRISMSNIEFPLAFCTLLWVCACMAIMYEFRQCGPDILAQHSAWNVLLLSSVCLKIPFCFSEGVRVIHAQQSCACASMLNLVSTSSVRVVVAAALGLFENAIEYFSACNLLL